MIITCIRIWTTTKKTIRTLSINITTTMPRTPPLQTTTKNTRRQPRTPQTKRTTPIIKRTTTISIIITKQKTIQEQH